MRKRRGKMINGWIIIDKPSGMTSAGVVSKVKAMTEAAKVGHGGTLDPLATGVLPLAFGEATKTVSYVMDGTKTYKFTVRWGEARTTDDAEGAVMETSTNRPDAEAIKKALPGFVGAIEQVPPAYSAIKVAGRRAYDLARANEHVELASRIVRIDSFTLVDTPDADHSAFEVIAGKGHTCGDLAEIWRVLWGPSGI
jgi:tRNA pseudouridine55 synthase